MERTAGIVGLVGLMLAGFLVFNPWALPGEGNGGPVLKVAGIQGFVGAMEQVGAEAALFEAGKGWRLMDARGEVVGKVLLSR